MSVNVHPRLYPDFAFHAASQGPKAEAGRSLPRYPDWDILSDMSAHRTSPPRAFGNGWQSDQRRLWPSIRQALEVVNRGSKFTSVYYPGGKPQRQFTIFSPIEIRYCEAS